MRACSTSSKKTVVHVATSNGSVNSLSTSLGGPEGIVQLDLPPANSCTFNTSTGCSGTVGLGTASWTIYTVPGSSTSTTECVVSYTIIRSGNGGNNIGCTFKVDCLGNIIPGIWSWLDQFREQRRLYFLYFLILKIFNYSSVPKCC